MLCAMPTSSWACVSGGKHGHEDVAMAHDFAKRHYYRGVVIKCSDEVVYVTGDAARLRFRANTADLGSVPCHTTRMHEATVS